MSIFNFKVCSVAVILVLLMLLSKKTGNKPGSVLLNDFARIQKRSVNVYKTIRPVLLSYSK